MVLGMSGMAGVRQTGAPSWGSSSSYNNPSSAGSAAFGGGQTGVAPSTMQILAPNDGFGLACTLGFAAIVLLAFIRYSLPR
jgi:hypothetical protein